MTNPFDSLLRQSSKAALLVQTVRLALAVGDIQAARMAIRDFDEEHR